VREFVFLKEERVKALERAEQQLGTERFKRRQVTQELRTLRSGKPKGRKRRGK
jgi:hypothetical protein